jgi:hypothetical protein
VLVEACDGIVPIDGSWWFGCAFEISEGGSVGRFADEVVTVISSCFVEQASVHQFS